MTELKNLPVNLLKLDMSFVRGITDDVFDQAIVESIIRLGRALNLGVIAEGIESRSIVSKLLELGCDRGQGYLISRPVAPIELAPMLEFRLRFLSRSCAPRRTNSGIWRTCSCELYERGYDGLDGSRERHMRLKRCRHVRRRRDRRL